MEVFNIIFFAFLLPFFAAVPLGSLDTVFHSFAFHSNYGRIFSYFGDIQRQRIA